MPENRFRFLTRNAIVLVLIGLCLFFGLLNPAFFSAANLLNVLRQVSVVGIVAVGMTFVMLTGGIDLSVGSVIGVSAVVAAQSMLAGLHPALAFVMTIFIGLIMGLLNGVFVNELRIPPLVATLGAMTAWRGLAFIVTDGLPVFGFSATFKGLGQGYVWFVPIPVVITTAVFLVGHLVLSNTRFGRYVYGVGSNEEASRLSGINVRAVKYSVYAISGTLSSLAGLVMLARINSGQPRAGAGYEIDVVTAVVLGGVSISGGVGKVGLVVIGVLIMGVLSNGMIMINIDEYVQGTVKGLVLIASVGAESVVAYRRTKRRNPSAA
jgi:ribose transport system permease protein